MLGFSARVQAQESEIQNNNDNRGIRPPVTIEDLLMKQAYDKAVMEFEKYIKTAQGNPCDLLQLSFGVYSRLLDEDTTKTAFYQEKADYYFNQYMQACGNTADAYLLKNARMEPQNFDSTVLWMTKAIELDSTYADLYLTRGNALWQLQQTEQACADFQKVKELNPFYADYYDTQCVKPEEAQDAATEPAPAE